MCSDFSFCFIIYGKSICADEFFELKVGEFVFGTLFALNKWASKRAPVKLFHFHGSTLRMKTKIPSTFTYFNDVILDFMGK